MVTYLIGTDGESASTAICDHLADRLGEDDRVRAIYAIANETEEAREAINLIEERLGSITSVETELVSPGTDRGPLRVLLDEAEANDADEIVIGLRRHSRTERVIVGSVSHSMIEEATIPVLMVPLPGYS